MGRHFGDGNTIVGKKLLGYGQKIVPQPLKKPFLRCNSYLKLKTTRGRLSERVMSNNKAGKSISFQLLILDNPLLDLIHTGQYLKKKSDPQKHNRCFAH